MKYQLNVDKIINNKPTITDKEVKNVPETTNTENIPVLETLLLVNEKEKNTITLESINKVDNSITEEDLQSYFEFQEETYRMFCDDNDITLEQFISFIQNCVKYENIDNILEATGRGVTRKVEKKLRKVNDKVNGKKNKLSKNIQRIDDKASDVANRKLDDIINTGRDMKREKLIEGRSQIKIGKFIKNSIMTLAGASATSVLFGPAVAAVIVAIGLLCRKDLLKKTEKREKERILLDLETDLKITREKIKDADGENDRKKKYQLMRIESTLEKEITRIKYNLRYY